MEEIVIGYVLQWMWLIYCVYDRMIWFIMQIRRQLLLQHKTYNNITIYDTFLFINWDGYKPSLILICINWEYLLGRFLPSLIPIFASIEITFWDGFYRSNWVARISVVLGTVYPSLILLAGAGIFSREHYLGR